MAYTLRMNPFLTIALLIASASTYAYTLESIDTIKSAAASFLNSNIQIEQGESLDVTVNPSNTPIEVPKCSTDLSVSFPKNSVSQQANSVEVSCNDSVRWSMVIPVDIQIYTNVLATKRTIPANEFLSTDDVDYVKYNKNRLFSGFYTKKEDVNGTITRHLLPAGTILTKKNIQQPYLVHRNQSVKMTSNFKGISVSMTGIAKSDGALHTTVKILNPSSKKTIDAVVTGPNTVEVAS